MSNLEIAVAAGLPSLARRIVPDSRHYSVPAGHEALLVRDDTPERTIPAREHRVRGFFQSTPELYLFSSGLHFLPLWITDLTTADGRAVHLGWRVEVEITDARALWDGWMRLQMEDLIPVPAELVASRMADSVQHLIQRYSLADLRSDGKVRDQVGRALSFVLKEQLDPLGLAIGAQFDAQQLRFLTAADLAAAARERAELQRILADEQLQTELNRLDNAEALAYRLQEEAATRGVVVEPQTAVDLAQQALALAGQAPATALQETLSIPAPETTPAPIALAAPAPTTSHNILKRISMLVLVGMLLAAVTLAVIAVLKPDLLATDTQRNQVLLGVAILAFVGVVFAWVIDQAIRWDAQRTADALLRDANLDLEEERDGRLELRHVFMLFGAMLGVGAAAAALWLPDHATWLRVAGAIVGFLGAAVAIRVDWLHNVERATAVVQRAQRRIAASQLDAAQRTRRHQQLQADLSAELEIVGRRLDEAAPLVYSRLHNRPLYNRVLGLRRTVDELSPRVAVLQLAAARPTAEWAEVDDHMDLLRAELGQAVGLAGELVAHAQRGQADGADDLATDLEQAIHTLEDELTRWKAVAA